MVTTPAEKYGNTTANGRPGLLAIAAINTASSLAFLIGRILAHYEEIDMAIKTEIKSFLVRRTTTPSRGFVRALATRCACICASALVIGVMLSPEAARASTDTQDCLAAIFSATGKFAQCHYKAEAKYFKSLNRPNQVADSAKCDAKLDSSLAKAYEKYGNACPDLSSTARAELRGVLPPASQDMATMVENELIFAMKWTAVKLVSLADTPGAIYPLNDSSAWSLRGDKPSIIVRPTSQLRTTESGGTASFAVVLNTPPNTPPNARGQSVPASVTVGLASDDMNEAVVSRPSLTFTSDNWDIEQTFDVVGVGDQLQDGDALVAIDVSVGSVSDAPDYALITPQAVPLVNVDIDTTDIVVTPDGAPMVTTEAGGTATFQVVLNFAPTAAVTIPIQSLPPSQRIPGVPLPLEGTVSPSSLTFTPTDWSIARTVTVTGVDDPEADGNRPYRIAIGPAASSDATYNGMTPPVLNVVNTDDEFAGITVFPQSGLVTSEAGSTATFQVVLNTLPTAAVTIPITSSRATEGTASPSVLTFTAADWNVPQTVTVTGVDDLLVDGDALFKIVTAQASSADAVYNGLGAADVTVVNTDNDTAVCGVLDKCIFLTSAVSTGNLGGLAGADAKCNLAATTAGLPGVYVAWLSSSTTDAIARVTSSGPYVTPTGDLVASSLADLTDGSLNTPIDEDETGAVVPLQEAWTATEPTGLRSSDMCADWTDGSASLFGIVGQNTSTSATWTSVFLQFCDHNVSLYCIQQ